MEARSKKFVTSDISELLGMVNDLVWSLSPDRRALLFMNATSEKVFGCSVDVLENSGRTWADLVFEDDRGLVVDTINDLSGHSVAELDFRIISFDGSLRHLRARARQIHDEQNRVTSIGVVAKDISEHVSVEKKLDEAIAIYKSLVESLPINIFRKDRDGRLIFVNKKYSETLGLGHEQLLGKSDHDLFDRDIADKYKKDDSWVLQTGLPFHDIEKHPNPNDDEDFLYVEVLKAAVTDANGDSQGHIGTRLC